jgi:hypothetical protein
MSRQSRPKAIKEYCNWCMGSGCNTNTADLIRECPSRDCELYPVRPYMPRAGKRHLAAAIEGKCFDCVGGNDDAPPCGQVRVRDCEMTVCAIHPVRPWQTRKGRGQYRADTPA